jgi:hypothetical protein
MKNKGIARGLAVQGREWTARGRRVGGAWAARGRGERAGQGLAPFAAQA